MYNTIYGDTFCDCCNRIFRNGPESRYVFREDLEKAGWKYVDGKLLCPDCASGKHNFTYTTTSLLTSYGL